MEEKEITKTNSTMKKVYITEKGRELIEANYEAIEKTAFAAVNAYLTTHKIFWMDMCQKEDVVAKVMCKVLAKGDLYKKRIASLTTWVNKIAVNTLKDFIKTYKFGEAIEIKDEDGNAIERNDLRASASYDPEALAEVALIQDLLNKFLEGKDMTNQIIMTKTVEGYKPNEIAKELGLTPNAVSGRLFDMRAEFREVMAAA